MPALTSKSFETQTETVIPTRINNIGKKIFELNKDLSLKLKAQKINKTQINISKILKGTQKTLKLTRYRGREKTIK